MYFKETWKSRQKNSFSVVDSDFDKNSDDCADKNRVSLIGNFAQAYCFCYPDEIFFFYLNITIWLCDTFKRKIAVIN